MADLTLPDLIDGKGKGGKGKCAPPRPAPHSCAAGEPRKSYTVQLEDLRMERSMTEHDLMGALHDLEVTPLSLKESVDLSAFKAAFEGLKEWQQKQIVEGLRKELTRPPAYSFAHGEMKPLDIEQTEEGEKIDWGSIVGVERSGDGSEGVIFVELPGKQALVVKAPKNIAHEVFGTFLCNHLNKFFKCPAMCVVHCDSKHGQEAIRALHEAPKPEDQAGRIDDMLEGKNHFIVYEYLQAADLAHHTHASKDWVEGMFGGSNGLSEHGKRTCHGFGSLLAFDMLINNFDRLPCIWANNGNPGNIMFMHRNGEVVSIDNMVQPITHADAIVAYNRTVKQVVLNVAQFPEKENDTFCRIRKLLLDGDGSWPGLGFDIGREGTLEVQKGFLDVVKHLVRGENTMDGCITRAMLEHFCTFFDGIHSTDVDFAMHVIDTFKTALDEASAALMSAAVSLAGPSPVPVLTLVMDTGTYWKDLSNKNRTHRADVHLEVEGSKVPITCPSVLRPEFAHRVSVSKAMVRAQGREASGGQKDAKPLAAGSTDQRLPVSMRIQYINDQLRPLLNEIASVLLTEQPDNAEDFLWQWLAQRRQSSGRP